MMWEAAARKMQKLGGRLLMGRKVEALAYRRERADSGRSRARRTGASETYRARHVLSSAPLREVMNALTPTPLSLFNARALHYRDFLTVVLIGRPQQELPDNWVYIHDPSVQVGRVQNFKSWSPEMIADGVSTCLGLEYFCFEGDGLWNAADDDLVALAKAGDRQDRPHEGGGCRDACVVRQAKAYPVYDESYAAQCAGDPSRARDALSRRCISSAATACTNTTIRIMR